MRSAGFIAALTLVFVSCQREESTITGRLIGFDGNPALPAHVYLADATPCFEWISGFGNSILASEESPSVEARFATRTPMHVLVNPSGKVTMVDSLLYENQLDSTLAQVFWEKKYSDL